MLTVEGDGTVILLEGETICSVQYFTCFIVVDLHGSLCDRYKFMSFQMRKLSLREGN